MVLVYRDGLLVGRQSLLHVINYLIATRLKVKPTTPRSQV